MSLLSTIFWLNEPLKNQCLILSFYAFSTQYFSYELWLFHLKSFVLENRMSAEFIFYPT